MDQFFNGGFTKFEVCTDMEDIYVASFSHLKDHEIRVWEDHIWIFISFKNWFYLFLAIHAASLSAISDNNS